MSKHEQCLPWHIGVHSEYAIQEDNDAQHRGRDKELSVNTQPGKIQPNLLSKILPVNTETRVIFLPHKYKNRGLY